MTQRGHALASVILPIREGEGIAWLALEGLARQLSIAPPWELLIGEETCGEHVFGECAIREWEPRLRAAGMVHLSYRAYVEPCTLGEKVWDLTNSAAQSSVATIYQGCDDLPHPQRLSSSYRNLLRMPLYQERAGMYLDLGSGRLAMYDAELAVKQGPRGKTRRRAHLNMAIQTRIVRQFARVLAVDQQTDTAFFERTKGLVELAGETFHWYETGMWRGGIWTHGRGHVIGEHRGRMIRECLPPFRAVDQARHGVPEDIWARLQGLCPQ